MRRHLLVILFAFAMAFPCPWQAIAEDNKTDSGDQPAATTEGDKTSSSDQPAAPATIATENAVPPAPMPPPPPPAPYATPTGGVGVNLESANNEQYRKRIHSPILLMNGGAKNVPPNNAFNRKEVF